ncbi:MAG: radical SAM protein [bacterium]|nr:radical SAM protein [bacterium]
MDLLKQIDAAPGSVEKLKALSIDPSPDLPVLSAKIKLLWQCNLSCRFCELPTPSSPMPAQLVEKILRELAAKGLHKVHFSGGEVFLHPQIMTILETACKMGLQVNFTSNGTLIDKAIARRLVDMGVHAISISIESAAPSIHDKLRNSKGSHKRTVKAVEYLLRARKKKPYIQVNTVITRDNIEDLDNLHQLLKDLSGKVSWKLLPVDFVKKSLRPDKEMLEYLASRAEHWDLLSELPITATPKAYDKFFKGHYAAGYYKSNPCYMPWFHLFIDPTGFVYPCCMTRGKIPALGKIPDQSLEEVLKGERMSQIRMAMASGHPPAVCHRCDDFIKENTMIRNHIR